MTWRTTHAYPFLFAVAPVARLVAENPGWTEVWDAALIVGTLLLACGLVYGLVRLAAGRRGSRLAPLVLMALVLAFWGYVRFAAIAGRETGLSHPVLAPLWALGTVGAIWWLVRRPAWLERTERFLTLMAALLVGWFVLSSALGEWRSARTLRQSGTVQWLAAPVPVRPDARPRPKPDIYLIVLDEYASPEVTARLFDFDNRAFVDSLRRLGFVVPAVHSNYLHTFLSLPSLLNSAHVAGLADDVGRGSLDRTLPDHLIEHNRAFSFLKSQGYTIAFFPSLWWESTRRSPGADLEFDLERGFGAGLEVNRTGLRQVLHKTSLLKYVDWGGRRLVRAHVTRTYAAMRRVPEIPGPVFAFAHVLSPHGPYVFDRNCRPARRVPGGGNAERGSAEYVEQIRCLNHLTLDLANAVLRSSDVPPVILIQGDHGSKTLLFDRAESAERISLAAAKERLGAFGAYYLPGRGREVFGDSVTIVNVMGHVLRHYLGAALPPQPDHMYLSVDAAPYAFKRVDFTWLAREDWSRPRPGLAGMSVRR